MGKKLVAQTALPAGHVLTAKDIAFKSPGDGTPPYFLDFFIGKKLLTPLTEDESIKFETVGATERDAKQAIGEA
jgi:N-acetylneuraminate synthase/sialic acid synthase